MAVQIYDPGKTELRPGQYLNLHSILTDRICGLPCRVVKVTPASVFVQKLAGDGSDFGGPVMRMKTSIVTVCDTFEEAVLCSKWDQAYGRSLEVFRQLYKISVAKERERVLGEMAALAEPPPGDYYVRQPGEPDVDIFS
jgi:hypothetical protein